MSSFEIRVFLDADEDLFFWNCVILDRTELGSGDTRLNWVYNMTSLFACETNRFVLSKSSKWASTGAYKNLTQNTLHGIEWCIPLLHRKLKFIFWILLRCQIIWRIRRIWQHGASAHCSTWSVMHEVYPVSSIAMPVHSVQESASGRNQPLGSAASNAMHRETVFPLNTSKHNQAMLWMIKCHKNTWVIHTQLFHSQAIPDRFS